MATTRHRNVVIHEAIRAFPKRRPVSAGVYPVVDGPGFLTRVTAPPHPEMKASITQCSVAQVEAR